jgi:hypothetical protein
LGVGRATMIKSTAMMPAPRMRYFFIQPLYTVLRGLINFSGFELQ